MSENNNSSNKRIAKNTVFLYFRMLLIMVVSLYTSRIVLAQLGVVDYGINNVVGGVVTMFSFLNMSMTSATQRFLTYELGKGNIESLKKVFAGALNIHIFIGLVVILFAETIGLWFVNYKLVIPESRMVAANCVYQFAVLSFFLNIIQVPYDASIVAHERMNIYAYISILEAVLKLIAVFSLSIISFDKLIMYSFLWFLVSLLIRQIYQEYCKRKFQECHFKYFWDLDLYKSLTGFAGWNLFGSIAWLLRNQGLNILMNLFFGPVINAAQGVAAQVSSAVMGFVTNFQTAMNPQITKDYAQGRIHEMESLVYTGSKFSFLLLLFVAFPLMINVDFVLGIWLKEVPAFTGLFVILIIIDALVNNLLTNLFITSLMATGNIRRYQMVVSSIILLVLPLGYIAFKYLNTPAYAVLIITIVVSLISGLVRFFFCKVQIGFSFGRMVKNVLLPSLLSALVMIPIPIYIKHKYFITSNWTSFFVLCLISVACFAVSAYFIGLNKKEKSYVHKFIKKKILHKNGTNL